MRYFSQGNFKPLAGGDPGTPPQNYTLVFEDRFTSIDADSWSNRTFYETAGLPDKLPNQYNAANVTADANGLHIAATAGTGEYLSGWLESVHKKTWTYGYFECKMRIPNVPGIWAGFFLVNDSGYPPEIDAGEILANDGYVQFQVREGSTDYPRRYYFGPGLLGCWHTFGFLWEQNAITWYIDGRPYWKSADYIPDMPMAAYIILGMGEWQAPNNALLPAVMDVEYLKIWQK
jgi:beta-glucanase (GH16 family)